MCSCKSTSNRLPRKSLTSRSKNVTTAEAIPLTINTWPVLYVYARSDLLLAYGISLLCALICSLVGLQAFFINNASYQNIFSTYLRATSDSEVRLQVSSDDRGSDPLPTALAKATVTLSSYGRIVSSPLQQARNVNIEMQRLHSDEHDTDPISDAADTTTLAESRSTPHASGTSSPVFATASTDTLSFERRS